MQSTAQLLRKILLVIDLDIGVIGHCGSNVVQKHLAFTLES